MNTISSRGKGERIRDFLRVLIMSAVIFISQLMSQVMSQCPAFPGTLSIPTSTSSIAANAYYGCTTITSVTIPSEVTFIGFQAFGSNSVLKCVYWVGSVITSPTDIFYNSLSATTCAISIEPSDIPTFSPSDSPSYMPSVLYIGIPFCTILSSSCCSGSLSISSLNTKNKTIDNIAYQGCLTLSSVIVPSIIISIGSSVFYQCTALSQATLIDGLVVIGRGMFSSSGLVSITIPSSVTAIGPSSFSSCSQLSQVSLNVGLSIIGESMFYIAGGPTALNSVIIPSTVTSVGFNSFSFCSALSQVTLSPGLSVIGLFMFYSTGLTSVTFPTSVQAIGSQAFGSISSLNCRYWVGAIISSPTDIFSNSKNSQTCFLTCNPYSRICCGGLLDISSSITSIAASLYSGCIGLSSLVVPSTIKTIGTNAFYMCSSLSQVTLQNGLTVIGPYMFTMNQGPTLLSSITIPSTITFIDKNAFYVCSSLSQVTLLNGLNVIGSSMFAMNQGQTSLLDISIPSTITTIGDSAFYQCSALSKVVLISGLTTIGASMFSNQNLIVTASASYFGPGPSALMSVTIPSTVTIVGPQAFLSCGSITEIILISGLTFLGVQMFDQYTTSSPGLPSFLKSIIIPSTITYMDYASRYGRGIFQTCSALSEVILTNGLTVIGTYMFKMISPTYGKPINSLLAAITIPSTVTSIGNWAFYSCTFLSTVTFTNGLRIIGAYMFQYASSIYNYGYLKVVSIPSTITSIGTYAFDTCKALTQIILETGLTLLGSNMFSSSSLLPSLTIPSSVKSIGDYVFLNPVSLSQITFNNGLTIIGYYMFANGGGLCSYPMPGSSLRSVTIPSTVTSIGVSAFSGFSLLQCIYFVGKNIATSSNFCTGYVCSFAATGTSIVANAYFNTGTLQSVVIYSSITQIGTNSFQQCPALSEVVLTNGLTIIGINMFYLDTALVTVIIPSTITSIGISAFQQCSSLSQVFLIPGLVVLGANMFDSGGRNNTLALSTVVIPSTLTSIDPYAFYQQIFLSAVNLMSGLTLIGANMFYFTSLSSLTIPASVSFIGSMAFGSINTLSLNCVYWLGQKITSPNDIFQGTTSTFFCPLAPSFTPTSSLPSVIPSTFIPTIPTKVPTYLPTATITIAPTRAIKVNGDNCTFPDGKKLKCNPGFYCLRLGCYICSVSTYCPDGLSSYSCPPNLNAPIEGLPSCITQKPSAIPTLSPLPPTYSPSAATLVLGDISCFSKLTNQSSCFLGQFCWKRKCIICPPHLYCPDRFHSYLCPPDLDSKAGSSFCILSKQVNSLLPSSKSSSYPTQFDRINVSPSTPSSEILALKELYFSTNGKDWTFYEDDVRWDFIGSNPCVDNWMGIKCIFNNESASGGTYHVSSIDLSNRNLIGTIPPRISNLTYLLSFQLRDNYLFASLPTSINYLTNIQLLDLSLNFFTGVIPLLSRLQHLILLNMSNNFFSSFYDTHPKEGLINSFDNLTNLKYLNLNFNPLVGFLDGLNGLVSLQALDICYTQISGTVPQFNSLTSLISMNLYNNLMIGTIPTFASLSTLIYLNLDNNFLNGSIPSFESLNLTSVVMNNNHLSGSVPTLSRLDKLSDIDISKNHISGLLPIIGNPNVMTTIIIGLEKRDNYINGPLPRLYCSYDHLQLLSIPISNGTCYPSCLFTYLNAEYITAAIRCPGDEDKAICDFTKSTNVAAALYRQQNFVQTLIDSPHPIIAPFKSNKVFKMQNVKYYKIQLDKRCFLPVDSFIKICPENSVSCFQMTCKDQYILSTKPVTISSSSFNISFEMNIPGNFYGYIIIVNAFISYDGWTCSPEPTFLVKSSGLLRKLDESPLSYAKGVCNWYGITCTKGQIISIALNNFNIGGNLSNSIALISTLQSLSLSSNSIKGFLPSSLGELSNLQTLDLSSNLLAGGIPTEILTIKSLIYLSLARNKLSGMISSNISLSLKSVLLSNNNLRGEIPSDIVAKSSIVQFDFQGNPGVTCFQPYSKNISEISQLGITTACSPTTTPTMYPTQISNPSNSNNASLSGSTVIIIATVASVVGLCLLIFFSFYYKSRLSKKKLSSEEKQRQLEIKERLESLPIHKILINERKKIKSEKTDNNALIKIIGDEEIIKTINENYLTIHELDGEDQTVMDILLKNRETVGSDKVIIAALRYLLPVKTIDDGNIVHVDKLFHHFSWIKVVSSSLILTSVVERILSENPKLCEELSKSLDEQGRTALQIAVPDCKNIIQQSLYLMKRYEITTIQPHHKSATCIIHLAIDHNEGQTNHVALKFMSNKNQFYSEIDARKKGDFDRLFVLNILLSYDSDGNEILSNELQLRELDKYPYILVMPMGNRDLDEIISKEFDSSDSQTTKLYITKIAKCLIHLHSKGYIHGDLKPKNIMRVNGILILIDLDGSASINIDYSGAKVSSAYLPPEIIYHDEVTNEYKVRMVDLDGNVSYEFVHADPAHDIWSLGLLVYFLCTGQSFFYCDKAENILDQDTFKILYEFSLDFKKKKLSIIADPYARNLVSQLLNKDPSKRISLQQMLYHPFITGRTAIRLVGEEPEFDVFISYRVASDSDHARILYEKLINANLKVWWDVKLLEFGKPWDEGFIEGLVKSRLFVPIFSRGAINHATNNRSNITLLKADSAVDNFLLEQRLALELNKRSMIELISPIMIGDFDKTTGKYANYFASGSHPNLTGVAHIIVDEIEKSVSSELDRLSLGLPMIDNATVKSIIDAILKNQGSFLIGDQDAGFDEIVAKISKAVGDKNVV